MRNRQKGINENFEYVGEQAECTCNYDDILTSRRKLPTCA